MSLRDNIGLRVKLHDLHVLVVVAEAGSMSKAAARLHTSQPAVSRSVAEMERVVGVPLLERSERGVQPTVYGRALLDGGLAAFDSLRQAATNIEFLADPTAGEVNIGCTPILAESFVSGLLAELSERHPRMVFNVTTGYLEDLRRDLCRRRLDLLIVRKFSPRLEESMTFEPLSDDHYAVCAGTGHPLGPRREIGLSELRREPWTLPTSDSVIGLLAMQAFQREGLDPPRPAVVANSTEVRLSLLRTRRFLTIFPASLLTSPAKRADIKALSTSFSLGSAENVVVTLKDRPLSKAALTFVACAREGARSRSVVEPRPGSPASGLSPARDAP